MALTVSPQVRIVALVAALAAAGLAVFMFTMGRPSSSVDAGAVPAIKPLYGGKKVAAHVTARPKPEVKKHAVVAPKPAPKPAVQPAAPLVTAKGLPPVVVRALERHPVVVVALYDPQARVDGISLGEANAGALDAGAGFVPLDVLDAAQAGPLMKQLGVLPDPAVLVYRRPGDLVARFDGFADRDTVAQSATNAMPVGVAQQTSGGPVVTRADWAGKANKICAASIASAKVNSGTARTSLRDAPRELARARATVAALAAIPLPTEPSERLAAQQFVAAVKQVVQLDATLFEARKRHDEAALRRGVAPFVAAVLQVDATAAAAGASACGAQSS